MSTYSLITDVRNEFKNTLEEGKVMTNTKVLEIMAQQFAVINSYIGTLYQTPVTGASPVNRKDTFTLGAINDNENYSLTITSSGVVKVYTIDSGASATAASIKTALINAINNDKESLIVATDSTSNDFITESRNIGFDYSISDLSTGDAEITSVNNQAAVLGSNSLRLLRKMESEMSACKIARILQTKVAKALDTSGVRQDILDGSCEVFHLKTLQKIQKGMIKLEDAELAQESGGLESHNSETGYQGFYNVEKRQW